MDAALTDHSDADELAAGRLSRLDASLGRDRPLTPPLERDVAYAPIPYPLGSALAVITAPYQRGPGADHVAR